MSYDAWLEEPYQSAYAAADRDEACADRADDEVGTDCGACYDDGDDKCRARVQCDECDRAVALGALLTEWQIEDAETGHAVMPDELREYFDFRDERRAARDAAESAEDDDGDEGFEEPDDDDCERSWCREP